MDPALRSFLIETGKLALATTDDFIPTLVVERGGKYDVMVLIGGHPFTMMQAALPTLREMQPDTMGLTTDSFVASGSAEDVEPRRARYGGSLQAMFEAGERGVTEALIIHLCSATTSDVITLPYTRTAQGIVWTDLGVPDEAIHSGRLIDVMRAVWA
jgi:hypothetical protein